MVQHRNVVMLPWNIRQLDWRHHPRRRVTSCRGKAWMSQSDHVSHRTHSGPPDSGGNTAADGQDNYCIMPWLHVKQNYF